MRLSFGSIAFGHCALFFYFLTLAVAAEVTAAGAKPQTEKLRFSRRGGFVDQPFELVLTGNSSRQTIRYTTDGGRPSSQAGLAYTNPIAISNTVVIRVALFRGAELVSRVTTHTFVILESVIHQTNHPPAYPFGTNAWNGFPSDYGMSLAVVNDPVYRPRIKEALKALPILSIAVGRDELFGSEKGIYLHSQERGEPWERDCSVEMLLPDGERAFQLDCGIRIQGNSNRIPEKTPKRSFRLFFREEYGPAKLHYPVFPDSPVEKFNTLILRADFNNSWTHWNPVSQVRGQKIRDAWFKDSQRAMGSPSTHTRFVHLYLNGLYWGIYDMTERPDATFAAAYFGKTRDDYDVVNELQSKDGGLEAYNALMAMTGLSDTAQYGKVQRMLDVTGFVDYLLVNYYAGNHDWGEAKNWYAIGARNNQPQFRYFCWDGEFILQDRLDNVVGSGSQPFHLIAELRKNSEFSVLMADRIQKHFFGAGALAPTSATDRWMGRARQLDLAIIAESARWGGHRREPPYTRDKDWILEQQRLLTNWFPQRTGIVLQQLRDAALYPPIDAPQISQGKSTSPETVSFTMTPTTNCTVFVTTNGVDPRVALKNTVHPTAKIWTNAIPVHLPVTIKARAKQGETWSALSEARY